MVYLGLNYFPLRAFQLQTLSQPLHCINLCKYKVMLMLLLVMQVEIYSR